MLAMSLNDPACIVELHETQDETLAVTPWLIDLIT